MWRLNERGATKLIVHTVVTHEPMKYQQSHQFFVSALLLEARGLFFRSICACADTNGVNFKRVQLTVDEPRIHCDEDVFAVLEHRLPHLSLARGSVARSFAPRAEEYASTTAQQGRATEK